MDSAIAIQHVEYPDGSIILTEDEGERHEEVDVPGWAVRYLKSLTIRDLMQEVLDDTVNLGDQFSLAKRMMGVRE